MKMRVSSELAKACHVLSGLFTSLTYLISPILCLISFLLFMIYEVGQYWYKDDSPSEEIREFALGFYSGLLVLLVLFL